ncbi:D-alanyl-D-alanine carboxypeptidase family protein [Microbacterium sp. ASV49]|uniref:D-alanyl-D-alanine carboxypeptidase n=1 Tax=Microbacterium candidum TaxID=3041922 RepID=A0ABT7N2R5_9MICO|nr:D-alanyl-D-alanine carboxypeptidase [Microbacterium sp. ASV49]MDL9980972.1 D-alanyl-D-alanine carboxypeptidase [Microbacterium sp. ASV49]
MTTQEESRDEFADLKELMLDEREYDAVSSGADQPTRRRRRRRGLIITAVVLLVLLGTPAGYAAWALNAPVSSPTVSSQPPAIPTPAAATLALPAEGSAAISVAGADQYLGADAAGIWKTSGGDGPRPIASISKLITALVVLHAKPLADANDAGPTITWSKAQHDLYDKYFVMGATISPMPTGSSMSERDAISTMLLPSSANYADALSTWAFGSPGGYTSAAKKWLAANGLTHTTIVEPTGMSARNTSTPTDLIKLGKIAATNPALVAIAGTKSQNVPGAGALQNTNDLLGVDGITGLKTGNLGTGTHNLLYAASLDVGSGAPLQVTGVMLGGQTHDSVSHDVKALLDSIKAGFHDVSLADAGQQLGTYTTRWGSSARMVIRDSASIRTWSDTPITVTMKTTTPTSYQDGAVVGSLTWKAGSQTVSVPVQIEGSIAPPTDWWRLTHPFELGGD